MQRWERDLHLPVHRIGTGSRSPVYASVPELRFWLQTVGVNAGDEEVPQLPSFKPQQEKAQASPAHFSHELVIRSRELVRAVAENSVRQQREAELLQKRILEIRSRLR